MAKISTGRHTSIYVASTKAFAKIRVATGIDSTANATVTAVPVFDLTNPYVTYSSMASPAVTGRISVLASDNLDFERVAMNAATFAGFDLGTALATMLCFGESMKDISTGVGFSSNWMWGGGLSSDGQTDTVDGAITRTYGYSATAKITEDHPLIVEQVAVSSGSGTLTETNYQYGSLYFLPAYYDVNGAIVPFIFDAATGTALTDGTVTGKALSGVKKGGSSFTGNAIVAYLFTPA